MSKNDPKWLNDFRKGKPLNAPAGSVKGSHADRYHNFRATAGWKRTVLAVLLRDPICRIQKHSTCQGSPRPAEVADHRIPTWALPDRCWYDMDNLQGACKPCNQWKAADDLKRKLEVQKAATDYLLAHPSGPLTF